jgi:hypothetical protein
MAPPLLFSMLLMAAARQGAAAEAPAPNAPERCGKVRPLAAEPASPWAVRTSPRGRSR